MAKNKIRLGVIGAGVQGYSQALHISEVMDVREICFFDNKRAAVKEKTSDYSTIFPEARVNPVSSVEELLELSDVVVTATTSRESVLPEKPDLLQGKTYIGVGSFKPGMQELPLALFGLLEKVYVDTLFAKQESGDLKIPLEKGKLKDSSVKTLGWHIETGKSGSGADDTKLFKSVGMALLDLVVAEHLYEKALSAGIGQKINL